MPYTKAESSPQSTPSIESTAQSDEAGGMERYATYAKCSCSTAAYGVCSGPTNKCPLQMPWQCLRQYRLPFDDEVRVPTKESHPRACNTGVNPELKRDPSRKSS